MCGISGIYIYNNNGCLVDTEELIRIRDHMANRGPDGKRCGLAHRRLAILRAVKNSVPSYPKI